MALSSSLSKHRTSSRSRRFFPFSCLAAHGNLEDSRLRFGAPDTTQHCFEQQKQRRSVFNSHTSKLKKHKKRRKARTKCWFFCIHVSCVESLVPCGVAVSMVEAGKPLRFECVQAGCHVVLRGRRGTLWHSNRLITCRRYQAWRKSRTKCSFVCAHVFRLESLVFLWLRSVYEGSCKNFSFFQGFQAGCHVVLRGRHGTLWHSNLFDNMWKISKLAEVSHEMLVFFAPTCLVSSLWFFLWRRRVYGGSSALHTLHFTLHTLHFTLSPTLHSTLPTLHSTLPHSTLSIPHLAEEMGSPFYLVASTHAIPNTFVSHGFHVLEGAACRAPLRCDASAAVAERNSSGAIGLSIDICISYHYRYFTSLSWTYVWAFGFVGFILFLKNKCL